MNFREFLKDEEGQDLIEYTLLMAFVALASAALFLGAGGSLKNIWGISNNRLSNAATRRPAKSARSESDDNGLAPLSGYIRVRTTPEC